jgi:hypothetical protein
VYMQLTVFSGGQHSFPWNYRPKRRDVQQSRQ